MNEATKNTIRKMLNDYFGLVHWQYDINHDVEGAEEKFEYERNSRQDEFLAKLEKLMSEVNLGQT